VEKQFERSLTILKSQGLIPELAQFGGKMEMGVVINTMEMKARDRGFHVLPGRPWSEMMLNDGFVNMQTRALAPHPKLSSFGEPWIEDWPPMTFESGETSGGLRTNFRIELPRDGTGTPVHNDISLAVPGELAGNQQTSPFKMPKRGRHLLFQRYTSFNE